MLSVFSFLTSAAFLDPLHAIGRSPPSGFLKTKWFDLRMIDGLPSELLS
jgi:hypothetical protein